MESEKNGNGSRRQKLRAHYRLVILNDETLKEVSSYRLNLLNLYILLSTLLILVGLLVFALLVFTPAKKLIPGYGDITTNEQFIQLMDKTEELEKELIEVNTYLDANKNRLLGNPSQHTGTLHQGYKTKQVDINAIVEKIDHPEIIQKRNIRQDQILLVPPVSGSISATYESETHVGIDIIANKNSAVLAIADGFVVSADYNLETGNTISIQHNNDMISFYKHNSSLLKNVGEFVQSGEAIAIVGNSGVLTSGPHLHFELWIKGEAVNPIKYIEF